MVIVALSSVYLGYVSKPVGGIQSLRLVWNYGFWDVIMTSQRDDVLVILTPFSRS